MENLLQAVAFFPLQTLAAVFFLFHAFVGLAHGAEPALTLPEGAEAPIPWATNARPAYPHRHPGTTEDGETVTLRLVVDPDGSVRDPQVLDGADPFARAALRAAERWRYEPARIEGRAIAVPWVVRVRFEVPPRTPSPWQVYRRARRELITQAAVR